MKCLFSTVFGQVGQGIHSYRLFNLAIVDVVGTVLGAFLIFLGFGFSSWKAFFGILVALFALGILLHRLFCVRTTVDRLLFP
jgi:hypothetical protein